MKMVRSEVPIDVGGTVSRYRADDGVATYSEGSDGCTPADPACLAGS